MQNKFRYLTLMLSMIILASACAPQPNSLVGATAPDFVLDDALGGQTSLSDYGGKSVLLFFHMAVG